MKTISYSKDAIKSLGRIPANERRRIMGKIEQYAADPRTQANNVKALVGLPYVRLRVGNWRVIMDDSGAVLEVIDVGARGSIYD